jgi:hypothetical protein
MFVVYWWHSKYAEHKNTPMEVCFHVGRGCREGADTAEHETTPALVSFHARHLSYIFGLWKGVKHENRVWWTLCHVFRAQEGWCGHEKLSCSKTEIEAACWQWEPSVSHERGVVLWPMRLKMYERQ